MNARKTIVFVNVVGLATFCGPWMEHREPSNGPAVMKDEVQSCRSVDPAGIEIQWIETADESDRQTLAAGCLAVGPVVVRGHAGFYPVSPLDSLFVLTWNTHVGGGDITRLVGQLREGEFTNGRRLDHFVILLQEAFRAGTQVLSEAPADLVPERIAETPPSGDRKDIVETARLLHLNLFYVPSMKNGESGPGETEEDRGNAILSTLPLHDLTAIELPLERHRRVAIAATVQGVTSSGESWTLRVCDVHLDNRTDLSRVLESVGAGRLRQAKALVPAVPGRDVLLGGDFNTWGPGSIENAIDHIREHFPQPARLDEQPTVSIAILPDRRTDYLFFRLSEGRTARYRRLDDRMGSDHYPLIGVVALKRRS